MQVWFFKRGWKPNTSFNSPMYSYIRAGFDKVLTRMTTRSCTSIGFWTGGTNLTPWSRTRGTMAKDYDDRGAGIRQTDPEELAILGSHDQLNGNIPLKYIIELFKKENIILLSIITWLLASLLILQSSRNNLTKPFLLTCKLQ